ncbi:hypothetical protein [Sphingobacterium hungaricum]|uniref:Restriction endonuclease n=1 Tax=Sphingobacterium hungaricum TaxID=2082723 RepID=A0A928V176_9SPHI|nr:hypothetical protein [Sphingobacterium hungaricum]MBE8714789.1 hypothetical protein [Sphingobacterium hungaricum]
MENQKNNITKGELMEELIRNYFINSGYFVIRGVKFRYENNDITDVDLYLYGRSSSITRQRINVDIKNKKSPQAFERILWANGVRELLNFDSCIVATTDQRPVVHKFGQLHNTIILDGAFLSKLRSNSHPDRLSEEELTQRFAKNKSYKTFGNKDWRYIYEESKSRLLSELDFSGFNAALSYIAYFVEKIITDPQKREDSTRLLYLITSHLLITIDFILKDVAFLDIAEREKKLSNGFKFGNLGKDGVDKIISIAVQISGNRSANSFLKSLEGVPIDILKDFFSKNENTKNLFNWARDFEKMGFNEILINPENIDSPLKGVISLLLDFLSVERKKFFMSFQVSSQTELPLNEQSELRNTNKSDDVK